MSVREAMTTNVFVADPTMTLAEAARKMRDEDFGSMPVGENDRLVGMITDRDLVVRGLAEGKDPASTTIRDVMSDEVVYCFDDQELTDAERLMAERQIRRLPVLNRDKRLVGIVSIGDLAVEDARKSPSGETLAQISHPTHH